MTEPQSVELSQLTVHAAGVPLLESTSASFPPGAITLVVGGSGSGKSVLLRILAGLVPSAGGAITWSGSVGRADGTALEHVGIVFQQFALFDELSPTANVRFAIDHRRDRSRAPRHSAAEWLDELRVPAGTRVAALSGGQKQRVAIARTLAADPEVLLYDEPTSGLDAASARQVAELIRDTQGHHGGTSVVVTHDFETLLAIADQVYLLDADAHELVAVEPEDWPSLAERMRPVPARREGAPPERWASRLLLAAASFFSGTGAALIAGARAPFDLLPLWSRPRWGLRFLVHYLRLVAGPSAFLYVFVSGGLIGYTATYFTFRFLPQEVYTKPLLIEDLLAAIGFALYRVLTPLLAAVLIAARCGAAAAADVGVRRYGDQIDAMRTLGVRPRTYLLTPILIAFLIGTPVLEWVSYEAARLASLVSFVATHPEQGPHFWAVHFQERLQAPELLLPIGTGWMLLKTALCGLGVAAIAYYRGLRPKDSARDVSDGITSTVLWSTLYVLLVHFLVAFWEY
ncbi:MAG: ATP-binding cassette domain-containing protein [bacterium]|nr:ATP-binding cassette domain-containing protein [bacterium]